MSEKHTTRLRLSSQDKKDMMEGFEEYSQHEEIKRQRRRHLYKTSCKLCREAMRTGQYRDEKGVWHRVPKWKAWECPNCHHIHFIVSKEVKDIDDLR